jgi:hypothetical protein
MASDRDEEIRNSLDKLYAHMDEVQHDTRRRLGIDALHIVDLHANNWTDIMSWINSTYPKEEQMNILVLQFSRLLKEIYWLELLLHNANYPIMYRNLRYVWEMICQAYYVDAQHPNLTLDDQIEKARAIEDEFYGWNLVLRVLSETLDESEEYVRSNFQQLWKRLSKHVHPSSKEMDIVANADFSILVTDSFNEELARQAMKTTDAVFDLVYVILFRRFSKTRENARAYKFLDEWKKYLPYTARAVMTVSG